MNRIYLSRPEVGPLEREFLLDALDSGWLAPLGPHVDALEKELAAEVGVKHAVALASGTAALHLALILVGVQRGDEVLLPTLTFVATANAVLYVGAHPVFVDSESTTWNIDPALLRTELETRAKVGRQVAAVVAVDLYGQCADYESILSTCREFGVPIIEDAAEALGATSGWQAAGSFGDIGVFSFNGNKIITTTGGGMLVTDRDDYAQRARHLATQARQPTLHFEHVEVGYNYRMSNLLAALGRAQLRSLRDKVERRRAIYERYRAILERPGISFIPEPPPSRSTRWLTVALIDPEITGVSRGEIIERLEVANIEARPAWKPMHRQPLFAGTPVVGGSVADMVFERGICFPSGSGMTDADVDRVAAIVVERSRGCSRPFVN